MDDDDQPVDSQVARWVEQAGFALELRVARAFTRVRNDSLSGVGEVSVEPSKMYRDADTWREADVVATFWGRRKPTYGIQVIAECKSGKKRPWVVFTDHNRGWIGHDESLRHALLNASGTADLHACWRAIRGTPCVPAAPMGYAITEGLRSAAGVSEDEGPNVPYRAIKKVLSAAMNMWARPLPAPSDGAFLLTLPIVVTAAPIYECALDPEGEVSTTQVQQTAMLAQPDSDRTPLLVQVMSESYLVDAWAPAINEVLRLL